MRRSYVFGIALALAAVSSAQGAAAQQQQPTRGHEQHAAEGRRQERLFQGIQLSDAQRQQIRQIFQEGRPERGARRERVRRTPEQRAELRKRREQHLARVRSVLTAEQRARFDRNLAQATAQRGQRGQQGGRR